MNIHIRFDGGCKPNPGRKYGSFEIGVNGARLIKRTRFDLGFGTSNEAEFEALLAALWFMDGVLSANGGYMDPELRVTIKTDSTVVANRLTRKNVTRKPGPEERMYRLSERCWKKLDGLNWKVDWTPREQNVKAFGH